MKLPFRDDELYTTKNGDLGMNLWDWVYHMTDLGRGYKQKSLDMSLSENSVPLHPMVHDHNPY